MSLLSLSNHSVTMSSREIAALVETSHDSVLKTVRSLVERGVVSGNETPYTHPQNNQTYSEFLLDFRNTMVVVSGYSAELRAKIIDRWQQLETQRLVPQTMPEALRLAADLAEQAARAEAALALALPKADALDRLATENAGAVCLRIAAKLLQMPEKKFLQFAHAKGFIFKGHHSNTWQGYSEKVKAGYLQLKLMTVHRGDGTERRVEQVLVTRPGLAKMAELLGKEQVTA